MNGEFRHPTNITLIHHLDDHDCPSPLLCFWVEKMEGEEQDESLCSPLAQYSTKDYKTTKRRLILEELKKQLWLAAPLLSVHVLQGLAQVVSTMFVGHLGKLSLSSASMATSFVSITGQTLLRGLSSALDTFCGQSYGARRYHMMSIHLQRGMIVLLLVTIPLAIIGANTEPILIALGQDENISKEAGTYAQLLIPGLFAYALVQCLIRFLQMQNIVFPVVVIFGITCLLNIVMCWILVFKTGLGSRGGAIAISISNWINVLSLALYVKFSPSCAEAWTGFSKEGLYNILSFLRLAIPSAFMECLENWSFELVVLVCGLLPNPQLETSVLSICLNTERMFFMVALGLGGSVSIRVSNELGAGRPEAARLAVYVSLATAISVGTLLGAVFTLMHNIWGYAYSYETEVVKYVAAMVPFVAVIILLDGLQSILSGIVRGCGRQKIGAYVNLGSYYLVGIPFGILLAFVFDIRGEGLWLGVICATAVQILSLLIVTIRTNWDQEANKATDRVHDYIPVERVS
ncbi:MATE efflux family protein [Tripterygium wilfordii]|uniref:Protein DETOXIFICATION n=1 Tax=Tripterygium wilfordii TaxID=458696 RepID=A0A7J7CKF7_TRIWF|nr:protein DETOXIFICATION 16-like [Tripterygium wilfordii]KAF5734544.1 MATE efflux family protein [Tripterygium wilfordii]